MSSLREAVEYKALRHFAAHSNSQYHKPATQAGKELVRCFGEQFWDQIENKVVIDFGSGEGEDAVEMVKKGARKVIGIDIQDSFLQKSRDFAKTQQVDHLCEFVKETDEKADVIVSKDSFEHYDDPAGILNTMSNMLKPGGSILISFGPTWLHPRGGHLFSVFPWSHLLLKEDSLIRWRSDFKSDGAKRFNEVAGGLNQITIKAFEKIVGRSALSLENLETIPIRGLDFLKIKALREFSSSAVRCRLVAPQIPGSVKS